MGRWDWYIVTTKKLYCKHCSKWIVISNAVPDGEITVYDLRQAEFDWLTEHCARCGDGDGLCECDEPVSCSALGSRVRAEEADSIPF